MAVIGTMTVTGASGEAYEFGVYPWGTAFKSVGGVYLITKRIPKFDGDAEYSKVYCSQTGDLSAHVGNHRKRDCFKRHGANSVCVLGIEDELYRLKILLDIMDQHDPVCNR